MKFSEIPLRPHFFDTASTTCCSPEAEMAMTPFHRQTFGNPSSAHTLGRQAAQGIREARRFFADQFEVTPEQVIFTGSGTEANNLAITGIALGHGYRLKDPRRTLLYSAIEHAAVKNTITSLSDFGFQSQSISVNGEAQIDEDHLFQLLNEDVLLVSMMRLNNIVGSVLPVEEIASRIKNRYPRVVFHTDAIQAFGKVECPRSGGSVDLLSLSGHKIEGPKGIGALIVLNRELLHPDKLRPIIWGGGQEEGFRSGTESPALIRGFYEAAKKSIEKRAIFTEKTRSLGKHFFERLMQEGLFSLPGKNGFLTWNSPPQAAPHIVNLSAPGIPPSNLAKFLEKKNCLVATGSACSSSNAGKPDATLSAMGLPQNLSTSSIRISFSDQTTHEDLEHLVLSLKEAHQFFMSLTKAGSFQF